MRFARFRCYGVFSSLIDDRPFSISLVVVVVVANKCQSVTHSVDDSGSGVTANRRFDGLRASVGLSGWSGVTKKESQVVFYCEIEINK